MNGLCCVRTDDRGVGQQATYLRPEADIGNKREMIRTRQLSFNSIKRHKNSDDEIALMCLK